ncbi:MAG: restriction endonuclease subunit S [Chloroflexi bacterium]|nr:restriction endonuclease subunit S [Chloroflexota bacterium]
MTSSRDIGQGRFLPLHLGGPGSRAPRGWTWKRLTDLARLESGHTPSRTRRDWWAGEIPWIALPDIRGLDGRRAIETLESINEEGIRNSSARILPEGTVVMSRTASVGFVTVMGSPMATSQDFVNWVCGPELHPTFLMHLLIRAREILGSLSSGAVHKTIYVPTVQQFWVCVPDVKRQIEVARELSEILAAARSTLDVARERMADVARLKDCVLREAFVEADGTPWPRHPLRALAEFISDGTHQPPSFATAGVPFLFVGNIVGGEVDFVTTKHVSLETFEELTRRRRPERGDVLYSAVGSFGVAVVVKADRAFTFQRHIAHIRLRPDIADPNFVAAYINSPAGRRHSESVAMGGAQRTVTLGSLASFPMPVPDLVEQRQIVGRLEARFRAIAAVHEAVKSTQGALEALPGALLRRAFEDTAA